MEFGSSARTRGAAIKIVAAAISDTSVRRGMGRIRAGGVINQLSVVSIDKQ